MLFAGLVHGHYLNPIQCNRWGVLPLGLREYETAYLEIFMYPRKTSAAPIRQDKKNQRVSYMLEDPEAKSTRERCIRVAAIVMTITLGVSNVCGVKRNKERRVSP